MAGSFYAQAAANRIKSFVLVLVIAVILGALGLAIGYGASGDARVGFGLLGIFGIISILSSLVGYYAGAGIVLAASKAREVTPAQAPQLWNVVQELAIAAGIPAPKVYLIDDTAPNAFATGRDPNHAAIAVTTGLVAKLDREELQGVIAHELSHVQNYDIRYAMLVGVLVGTIALVSDVFLRMTFWGGFGGDDDRDSDSGGLQILVFILAILLAVLAPIFSSLVQLAVSRQREYLADATSVGITRNPYGLQRALAKIATDQEVLEVANRATQHLYFANPIKKFEKRSKGLMSTHPPIVDRINRLRSMAGERPISEADLVPPPPVLPPLPPGTYRV